MRIEEMHQSIRIIKQAMAQIPSGEIQAKVPRILRPPKGEAYAHVEAPKGELGFYIVSDGSTNPYRLHIRSSSFINLRLLRELMVGTKIADAIVIFGSIDICLGEVDR